MKILITGGGTGGHIYPALALVNHVKQVEPNTEFMYVGSQAGLESQIVPKYNIPFKTIKIQGFRRSLSPQNIKTVYLFLSSIGKAKKIIRDFQPDIVIGTGGYVSGSVVYAAKQLKIPTIIHEQNSIPGMTNKFLSRYVTKVAICFPDVAEYFPKEKVVLTGNPRAQEVVTIEKTNVLSEYGLDPKKKTVVIFGGSRGALKINQAFIEAFPLFEEREYQVLYASGERYYKELQETLNLSEKKLTNISIQPYIDKMAEVLAAADLMVGRAGATSIAEFTALGLPAILIPSPYVTNDHQTKNAQSLVRSGAVEMITDQELTGPKLVTEIDGVLLDDTRHQSMAEASKKEGIPDAAERLYKVVKEIT
ncbi:undecaprenyldiphospho-muramoylpentapeptide beta-N-acetylglucosaminyltransferase [Enterococcus haemoperoxidus ATCC BAA-382]|uniref:UDP-N-acetylglucosamine--N-acetylmuramyl-(pentapeptide) pyrophosphoryl-undecaprenol N-acetylglucosamine transferase n=1 Tax=Enterococcus haemoperoxidus ATCC BAA-382 TaxID=1158608 RepID=R2SD86_9ENTE|nr:undecaprenyldiphospho-muramoylpentapeptide beta-N-acetylglucosaminyltransferase [Enterococcus haemoperoxidus]EOH93450.1 undecaprenyldiphospho-muramoylpentapeptide beta-N-acetylglucosaminyltransferase [Enterococcus haemoperoxidus ATCC BAA-382]EOT61404.1 undecaprenyldiphospho-muramoylpentapeptide beta-N-acetylglucosaminyltransferase [Enterococcus haemoperoxidus ATCC BAA-382]OJG51656.1 undecaprenyldiphospho-muramoylpentapeptide beta-N-acetylglucosaminyltransferase [Enterococcus haemoperoxidus]